MAEIKSLSWSKIYSFENFRSQFIKTYFEEAPFFETKEIAFGKVLGTMIEERDFDEDVIIKALSKDRNWEFEALEDNKEKQYRNIVNIVSDNSDFCEKLMDWQFDLYPTYEQKLQQFIDWICCLGFIDNSPDIVTDWLHAFREFKTGKTAWTQERAENHWQLYFYAMLIEAQSWYIPQKAYLDWIVTSNDENGNIIPTWEIQTFEVKIDPKKVESMKKKVPKIFAEMQEAYETWIKSKDWEENLNEDIYEEYAWLESARKNIEVRQKELKKEIDKDMRKHDVTSFKKEWIWNFFYMARKKWIYPEDIVSKEETITSNYKQEMVSVNELKHSFEESHDPEISYNLSFRLWK